MRLVLVTPPAATPITLSEAKAQARVAHDDEDLLLQHYIDAATAWLAGPAGILGRCLVTQTWRAEVDAISGPIWLPFPDSVIDSAVFIDPAGGEMEHELALQDQRLLLRPSFGLGRPAAITFTAGYGAPADVPAAIRQAMLLLVTQWYEHRQVTGTGAALPFAVEAMLAPYRRIRL
ncbi:head-tail connector protein [Paracoccus niistensis]|uniref:Head-tail connector protein n=1 Tax=Paracoccus niistensis TaxID=632935 RepID=A0ABV6I3I2_9RHOB